MNKFFLAGAMSTSILLGSAAVAFAETGVAPGSAKAARLVTAKNCGALTRVKVKTSNDLTGQGTFSTTFVDVINSPTSFRQKGSGPGCAILNFSAQAWPSGNTNLIYIQALLDGVTPSLAGEIQFNAGPETYSDAHSYNFVFPSVAPGLHVVKVQMRTLDAANTVFINDFSMVLNYR